MPARLHVAPTCCSPPFKMGVINLPCGMALHTFDGNCEALPGSVVMTRLERMALLRLSHVLVSEVEESVGNSGARKIGVAESFTSLKNDRAIGVKILRPPVTIALHSSKYCFS